MKQLNLTGTTWMERRSLSPSPDLLKIIEKSPDTQTEEDTLKIKEFFQQLIIEANSEDAAIAQEIYDKHKIEGAQLIAADIELPSGRGIINCRIEKEHRQIRF